MQLFFQQKQWKPKDTDIMSLKGKKGNKNPNKKTANLKFYT